MNMFIEIPSGKILLNGNLVESLKHKPYTLVNGEKVFLTEEEKRMAREMRKAFAQIIDMEA